VPQIEATQRLGNQGVHIRDSALTMSDAASAVTALLSVAEWFAQHYDTPRTHDTILIHRIGGGALPGTWWDRSGWLSKPSTWSEVFRDRSASAHETRVAEGARICGVQLDFLVQFIHLQSKNDTTAGIGNVVDTQLVVLGTTTQISRADVAFAQRVATRLATEDTAKELKTFLDLPSWAPVGWFATILLGRRSEHEHPFVREARQLIRESTRGKVELRSYGLLDVPGTPAAIRSHLRFRR
jgi:hypothetical protein